MTFRQSILVSLAAVMLDKAERVCHKLLNIMRRVLIPAL